MVREKAPIAITNEHINGKNSGVVGQPVDSAPKERSWLDIVTDSVDANSLNPQIARPAQERINAAKAASDKRTIVDIVFDTAKKIEEEGNQKPIRTSTGANGNGRSNDRSHYKSGPFGVYPK